MVEIVKLTVYDNYLIVKITFYYLLNSIFLFNK